MHIKLFILSVLIFASLNPKDVSAATLEPPKVYVDGIVRIAHTERLAAIPLPELTRQPIAEKAVYIAPVRATAISSPSPKQTSRGAVAGNNYYAGQCVWHVKNKRPDIPNSLGSAGTWYARAQAQGFATGSTPKAGAVAWAKSGTQHVALVTGVNPNGTVNIEEMNYKGPFIISYRTTPASDWLYIY